jgi:hypothetical protein
MVFTLTNISGSFKVRIFLVFTFLLIPGGITQILYYPSVLTIPGQQEIARSLGEETSWSQILHLTTWYSKLIGMINYKL